MDVPAICAEYLKSQVIQGQRFSALGQVANMAEKVTTNSFDLVIDEIGFKKFVEILE